MGGIFLAIGREFMSIQTWHLVLAFVLGYMICVYFPGPGQTISNIF